MISPTTTAKRPAQANIFIIAQNESEIEPVRRYLAGKDYQVQVRLDVKSVDDVPELGIAQVCLVDMRLHDRQGVPLYRWVRDNTDADVVGLCERSDLTQAVHEVNRGILYDYLIIVPIYDIHQFEFTVRRALQKQRLDRTVKKLMNELDQFRSQYLPHRLEQSREYVRKKLDRHLDQFLQSLASDHQETVMVRDQQGLQQLLADFKTQKVGSAIQDLKTQLYEDLYLQVENAQEQFQADLTEEQESERSNPVIMVVDDEEKVRKNVADILSSTEYEVADADTGEKALRMSRTSPPDLILMDIAMPGISGIEVLEVMKQEKPLQNIPVIMLTGIATHHAVRQALQIGATDYVIKPFHTQILLERIGKVLKSDDGDTT